MVGTVRRGILISVAALAAGGSQGAAAAQSNIGASDASAGHGLWLPLSLILILTLLSAPAVLPEARRRVRRS